MPLSIVRPSIVCAAWAGPVPGWVDSPAAIAGCLLYTGLGVVKAFVADPGSRLDVIPVDVLSHIILDAAFVAPRPSPQAPLPIRHAAMGVERALRIDTTAQRTAEFFASRPGVKARPGIFIGRRRQGFARADLFERELPTQAKRLLLTLLRRAADRRRLERADAKIRYMNSAFEYFTHHTFDFRSAEPVVAPGFKPERYIELINRGMYRHLLGHDESQLTIAGETHDDARGDVAWVRERPSGGWTVRTMGFAFRKVLRRCTTQVTFDRSSFERAVAQSPADALFVLAPSHRSYFDFLLSSYLCFQHPELGIPVPHIAAAEEFSKIPLVGDILRQARAFYIQRGVGKEVPEVSAELKRITAQQASLMFFVEGQRSRARRVLPPKRGLLRGLQATGRTFTVLPLAVSYDRVPEERAFERELSGGAKSRMSLRSILKWLGELAKGDVQLGRVHITCGAPVLLHAATDVQELAKHVVSEQQRHTVVTGFHLRTFLESSTLKGVDEAWLTQAIRRRGGRVLDSALPASKDASPALRQSLQNQWMHWFYADALRLLPNSSVMRDHVARHRWVEPTGPVAVDNDADPRVLEVVQALFGHVLADYDLVVKNLGDATRPTPPEALIRTLPVWHLPHVEDAYQALVDRGVLTQTKPGNIQWGPHAHQMTELATDLPPNPRAHL